MIVDKDNYKLEDITLQDIYKTANFVDETGNNGVRTSSIFELALMFRNPKLKGNYETLYWENLKNLKEYSFEEVKTDKKAKLYKEVNDWFRSAREVSCKIDPLMVKKNSAREI